MNGRVVDALQVSKPIMGMLLGLALLGVGSLVSDIITILDDEATYRHQQEQRNKRAQNKARTTKLE
jgi:hypothetical protein